MKATLVTARGRVQRLKDAWARAGQPWPRVKVVDAPGDHKKGAAMVIGSLGSVMKIARWTGGTLGTI